MEVRYGTRQPEITGYSGNVSSTGIMIRAVRVFAPGTILALELKLPSGTHRLRAQVTWAREGSVTLLSSGRVGMGLRFLDPPPEFVAALHLGKEAW